MIPKGSKIPDEAAMKAMLHRIVARLTRMAMKFEGVVESSAESHAAADDDHEHRFAEYEHEHEYEYATEPAAVIRSGGRRGGRHADARWAGPAWW